MNSQVLYVVCSFSTVIDSPSFGTPTPTNGAPPPVKLLADWLAIPPAEPIELVEPAAELSVGVVAPPTPPGAPIPPGDEDPNPLVPGDEDPNPPIPGDAPPTPVPGAADDPPIPGEAIDDTEPKPGASPTSGCPKNPFTVVLASPT